MTGCSIKTFLNIAKFFSIVRFRKENKNRRNKIFIGIIVVIFLVSSIAGVVLFRSDNNTSFNSQVVTLGGKDYTFEQKTDSFGNPYYSVTDKTDAFDIYYMPQQLSALMDNATQSFIMNSNYFYLTFSPEDPGIQYMDFIRFDLKTSLPASIYFADAVTEPSDKYPLPIVTCLNSSVQVPVLLLESANKTNITMNGSCVVMDFAQYDALRIRDSFVYLSRGIYLR